MNAPVGIGLQLCATFFFALMSGLARILAEEVPSGQIVFMRSFVGLVPVLVWLLWTRRLFTALGTAQPVGHVVRGVVGVSAMWMAFAALAFIPLAEAIAFSYATPLVTVVLAVVLLGERVPAHRWIVLAIGFAGILLMLWPSFDHAAGGLSSGPLIGAGLALAGAVGAGFAVTQVRHLTRTETSESIVFYFSLVASIAGLVTAPFGWVWPDTRTTLVLVGTGLFGGIGQICMTTANRYAPASVVAPLNYATLLWATAFGAIFLGELPHPLVAIGALVVVASGMMLVWRERPQRERDRNADADPGTMTPPAHFEETDAHSTASSESSAVVPAGDAAVQRDIAPAPVKRRAVG